MNDFNSKILYTIGYSNHDIDYFVSLLKMHEIQAIADVRSYPYSSHNPDFSFDKIKYYLKINDMNYVFLGKELGARRSEIECYKENKVDYKLVQRTKLYNIGIERILTGVSKMNIALMCAEQDPISCHRAILITRSVDKSGVDIRHILPSGEIESQKELDERLLTHYKNLKNNRDLFLKDSEILAHAYELRGEEIAYERKPDMLDT